MKQSNLSRMIELAEGFFETKNDPDQISVTEEVMERLRKIHPATLAEEDHGKGPVAWVLLIPTTEKLMRLFVAQQISEKDLLQQTPIPGTYEAIYLCSALVLPEYRGKGLAKRLACRSVEAIVQDHPVKHLFYWAFSPEGAKLATSIANRMGLPLLERANDSITRRNNDTH